MSKAKNAAAESGRAFMSGATGRWAGERLLKAMKEGREISPAELRTNDTLRKDEWKAFDEVLIEEGAIRLRGVADLIAAGLTTPVANAMGKTLLEYEKVTDMNPAEVSMGGVARTEDDRQEFSLANLPLPIIHKDFNLNLRTLTGSRTRGESLDTTQVRTSGRLVSEALESMLFAGGPTFGGSRIWGYTNHPDRNTGGYVTNGAWSASAKVGADVLEDVLKMITALEADRMFGPYWIYVSSNASTKLEEDFKANGDKTIRQRVLEVDRVNAIRVVDQLAADTVIMVQATSDVVTLVTGEPLQTVQWDVEGGFHINFKAFTIQVPLIRSDAESRSGVYHMS